MFCQVVFNYRSKSSEGGAKSLCNEVRNLGSDAVAVEVDIAAPEAPQKIIASAMGAFCCESLDILVNNAGLGGNTSLLDITRDEYELLMNVNVKSLLFMTQTFVRHVRPGGRIINLSSISARGGYATQTVYAASKAAVEAMTRVWATELGHSYQITVNAINPGPVDTDMYRDAGDVHLARMAKDNMRTPAAPRAGTPKDIADIVCFLCDERSRWISGDVVCANGGMLFT